MANNYSKKKNNQLNYILHFRCVLILFLRVFHSLEALRRDTCRFHGAYTQSLRLHVGCWKH